MAAYGTKDLMLTIYGLDVHDDEVDASVFVDKMKKVVTALRKLDTFYNTNGHHKFMINDLKFSSASVWLREKQIKSKRVRQSPTKRFIEIGTQVSSGSAVSIQNSADEYALATYENLSKGAGRSFSYGIVEAPEIASVRLDSLMEKRVKNIIATANAVAESTPKKFFQGTAIETFDGIVKAVDLRGLFPEAKLILSAGQKQISCIVAAEDVEMLRAALDNRALVTGRAQYDGRSMIPERMDVIKIKLINGKGNILSLKGALKGLDPDFMREVG